MKNKKNIIIILIIVLIIIGLFVLNQYITNISKSTYQSSIEHKNFRIVCLYGTSSNLTEEQYLIIDSNRKVVEVRRIITGYTDEELNNLYNEIKTNGGLFDYNVEIRDKSIIYSSIVLKGQDIDSVIKGFKANYKNVTIKEI